MRPTLRAAVALTAAVFAGAPALTSEAAADEGPLLVRTGSASVKMIERASRLIDLPDNITHVTDFDETVVLVEPISPTRVRFTALKPGVTSVAFTDANGTVRRVEVFVTGDTRHLEAHLRDLFPHANVRAVALGQAVVLRGFVTEPSLITQIVDVAGTFYGEVHNQIQVSTNDRVVLHVKVAEVNRSKARELGFNWSQFGGSGALINATGGVGELPAAIATGVGFVEGPLQNANIVGSVIGGNGDVYSAFLEALKTESLLKILAEPSVTATSGRPATLLSGGEFPVLVPQGLGTTAIQFKNYGIKIEAVPVVLGNGRIRLDIAPEVSDLDFANGVTLDGVIVPALSTRRVNTQAEMTFGETLVLGGLISNRRIGQSAKVPFLGDLPYIGAAFSRKSYENTETELLIMVTPMPAAAFGPDECPPLGPGENTLDPTDKELYFYQMLEVPRYGEECGPGGCSNASLPGLGGCQDCGPATTFASPASFAPRAASPQPRAAFPAAGGPSLTPPPTGVPTFSSPALDAGFGPSASVRRPASPVAAGNSAEGVIRLRSRAATGPRTSGPVTQVSAGR